MKLSFLYEDKKKKKTKEDNERINPSRNPRSVGGQDADAAGTSSKSARLGPAKGATRAPYTGPYNYD